MARLRLLLRRMPRLGNKSILAHGLPNAVDNSTRLALFADVRHLRTLAKELGNELKGLTVGHLRVSQGLQASSGKCLAASGSSAPLCRLPSKNVPVLESADIRGTEPVL